MLKKIIIFDKKYRNNDREEMPDQEGNLVLPQDPSIVDLPSQIGRIFINEDEITFKAVSWCMFPVIWAGDILKIEPIKPKNAKIGEVVLYKTSGRVYAHRLVKTYEEKNRLYMITSGEKEYRNNQFSNYGGIPAENILGKVIEIRRGGLCFRPDEVTLNSVNLMKGRLKLFLWGLMHKIRQYIAKIFKKLQEFKLYRCFFEKLIKSEISFFAGTSVTKNKREIHNFCFYQAFDDFSKDFIGTEGLHNLSARINNKPVGNVSLYLEKINDVKVCTLSNFIVRVPYRGGKIGFRLLEKAIYLCDRINIDEVKVILFAKDKIVLNLFLKLGFSLISR